MKPVSALLFATLLLLALVGCGQKGPLYLPEDDQAPAEESGSSEPARDDRQIDEQ